VIGLLGTKDWTSKPQLWKNVRKEATKKLWVFIVVGYIT
jgi:hypothetical protein